MMKFNKEQADAINQKADTNVLISAGAGSGKTAALSEKVLKMIESEEIKPSQLLVLTFTNNAAHSMKMKIQKKFSNATDSKFKDQMLSSHIQTFDSFMQYLVKRYASNLGISDSFTLANDSFINIKKEEFLDEILDDYFNNNNEQILKVLERYSFLSENSLKNIINNLFNELNKLPPSSRDKVLNHYDENYLTKEFYDSKVDELIKIIKERITISLKLANFYNTNFKKVDKDTIDEETFEHKFDRLIFAYSSYKNTYECDINCLNFKEDYENELYDKILNLLKQDKEHFLSSFNEVINFIKSKDNYSKKQGVIKILKSPFSTDTLGLNLYIKGFNQVEGNLDYDYQRFVSMKDDIHFFINVINKLYTKLNDYKNLNQTYTFSDISEMASRLLTEDKFSFVSEDLKNTYKYIMIDEYQDTNDSQEIFINTLLEKSKSGSMAKVFCVGDAKQSIYAFRNSNVELFRRRQELYSSGDKNNHVIHMNKNYRSGKKLLSDINYIFKFYMSLNHGGINYKDDLEQLKYDDETNIYNEPYDEFSVERIVSCCGEDDNTPIYDYEVLAIINDIQNKIENKYLIYDKDEKEKKIRPCRYSDFCILIRGKRTFDLYQKYFAAYNIPLNVKLSSDLSEQRPITVLNSLLKVIALVSKSKEKEEKFDIIAFKHLLCSIARSYIYNKDDDYVQEIIDSTDIFNNELYLDIKDFIYRNKDKNVTLIFDNLINDFNIVTNLYKLDNVVNSINKLESLRTIFASQTEIGYGIDEFVNFLNSLNYYKMAMKEDAQFSIENAVDLMTIHASKGLEKKIVYMPLSLNKLAAGVAKNTEMSYFDLNYGLLLPDFDINKEDIILEKEEYEKSIFSLPYILYLNKSVSNKIEVDEHVRLFYVALTRAQNKVIIVGDKVSSGSKETLYDMLDYCPHYLAFDEKEISKLLDLNVISKNDYNDYQIAIKYVKTFADIKVNIPLTTEGEKIADLILNKFILKEFQNKMLDIQKSIKKNMFFYYLSKIETIENIDLLAKFYGYSFLKAGYVEDFEDLNNKISSKVQPLSYDDIADNNSTNYEDETSEDDIENETDESDEILVSSKNNDQKIKPEEILNYKESLLVYKDEKKLDKLINTASGMKTFDNYILGLAYSLDNVKKVFYKTYHSDEYEDKVRTFDISKMTVRKEMNTVIKINRTIDDTKINFEERKHARASKDSKDEDISEIILTRGIYLHQLLENVDLKKKDTSFIKDDNDRKLIDEVLNLDIFKDLDDAKIYKEYGYFDDELNTTGFIDLLIIRDGIYNIIDYKTSNYDDPSYINQLDIYQRNVEKLFNTDSKHINRYLLSILKCKVKKI